MSSKRMLFAGVLILTVVFLSPIAFMAGQRAGLWLTTPTASEGTGPWPSVEDGERDSGNTGERLFQPAASPVAEV